MITEAQMERSIENRMLELNLSHKKDHADPSFIPLNLTGGIGDVIMAIDAIEFLRERHLVAVHTPHAAALQYFCPSFHVYKELPDYTWHLDFNTTAEFKTSKSFHGFLMEDHERLFVQQQELFREHPALETIVKDNDERYYLTSLYGKSKGWDRRSFPMKSLGFMDDIPMKKCFKAMPKKQITIHDGFDLGNGHHVRDRCTKQWDIHHWATLIEMLKVEFRGYDIIQLGNKTARHIPGVDIDLVNKTTIPEAFNVLSESSLHIDGDSGLVHAATRMQVPCVVMFGPTPDYFFGYKENININQSPCKHACYWFEKDWMGKCAVGYMTSKCMDNISPETVLKAVQQILI